MVVLAIGGLAMAVSFCFAAKMSSSARERNLAMAVAQQQMEQYRNLAFNDAGLAATANGGASQTIIRGGRRYLVLTTITDSNLQNGTARTKTIQMRVVPSSDGAPWARNVTSMLG